MDMEMLQKVVVNKDAKELEELLKEGKETAAQEASEYMVQLVPTIDMWALHNCLPKG